MSTLILLAALVVQPPDGYRVVDEDFGCVMMVGEDEPDGVTPGRAECHWPDISQERFNEVLGNWNGHDLWGMVVSSKVVRREGQRELVHQVHHSKGISERETLIWAASEPVGGGGMRYTWSPARDQALELGEGRVFCPRDEGYWQAVPHPDGGIHVSYYLAYDPGGKVPGVVVKWFQKRGLSSIVEDLYTALRR